jgi:hypothetical protein
MAIEEENDMLDYAIMKPEGMLIVKPHAPLAKEDFSALSASVNAYLAVHATLRGVLIQAETFPGWADFAGFSAHLHFVGEHHRQVERVAIVTDSKIAPLAEALANHFSAATVKHFPFADAAQALEWLEAPASA